MMEAEDECSFSLMCQEDGTDLDDDGRGGFAGDNLFLVYNASADEDDDEEEVEEYMDHLFSKESSFCSSSSSSSSSCFSDAGGESTPPPMATVDWFHRARRATVKWILETRACFGFSHRTAYLAIAYFDCFCLRRSIDRSVMPWAARLLAVACVSVAAKMEEYRAPPLSEFRAAGDGDDGGEYEFSSVSISRMELLVLSTLGWRMAAVTPFDYLPCLLRRNNDSGDSGGTFTAVKAAALVFSSAEAASVLDHRPSTVATAAILAAATHHGAVMMTREALDAKMSCLSPSFLLDKDDVYTCYSLMLSSSTPASKTTTASKRSSSSSSCSDSTDAAAAASFATPAAAASSDSKRMRLEMPGGILR